MGKYAYTPKLRKWLRAHGSNFDAWILNGLWQFQGVGASRVARELGIPYFVYPHGMLDPWNRRANPIKYVKKFLYWLLAERAMLEHAKRVLFTSKEESILARRYFPAAKWRDLVVGNGIAEPPTLNEGHEDRFREKHSILAHQGILLFLSRIHPKKGIDVLLRTFASMDRLRTENVLVIAGTGEEAHVQSLKELTSSLGLDESVRWVGPLYEQSKWEAFSAADLFVLPSHQENFGIAVAEALAVGTPVCTTTGVNIYKLIEQYEAGIVCRDNETDLRTALEYWQGLTARQLSDLKSNARRCFEEQFRVAAASNRLLAAITAAIQADGSQVAVEGR
jgi:glycosyltransferase involved in cell wall biosynthesis